MPDGDAGGVGHVDESAGLGHAPDLDVGAALVFEVVGELEGLAFAAAEFEGVDDEEDAAAGEG